jgi:hypothetical protein
MKNTISKTKKSKDVMASKSNVIKRITSEEDIRNRAFEIYIENKNSSSTALDNWFYAKRELDGYYK